MVPYLLDSEPEIFWKVSFWQLVPLIGSINQSPEPNNRITFLFNHVERRNDAYYNQQLHYSDWTWSFTRLNPRKPAKSRWHETTRTDLEAKRSTGEPYDYFFLKSARRDESNGTLLVRFRAGNFLKSVFLTIGPLNRINQSIAQCAGRPAYCLTQCAGRPACHSLYLRYDTKLPTSLTCWKRLPVAP